MLYIDHFYSFQNFIKLSIPVQHERNFIILSRVCVADHVDCPTTTINPQEISTATASSLIFHVAYMLGGACCLLVDDLFRCDRNRHVLLFFCIHMLVDLCLCIYRVPRTDRTVSCTEFLAYHNYTMIYHADCRALQ